VDVGLRVYFEGSDFVRISDNRIEVRPDGLVGIVCQANHRYLVERNTVIARGTYPDGIYLWASDQTAGVNGSTVRGNRVVMEGSDFGGISVHHRGSRRPDG
jgi:hypothetical protein